MSCYENESAGSQTVTELFDAAERLALKECECDSSDREPDPDEGNVCAARLARYSCIEPIVQRRAGQIQEWAECSLAAFRELERCYERFGCDFLAVDTCLEDVDIDDACGELPDPIDDEIEEEIENTCLGPIECNDGSIATGNICNEMAECADGSDEVGCPSDIEFTCDSGDEVSITWVCDGFPDCEDGSDETEAQCASSSNR